jgi:hypothetical protein
VGLILAGVVLLTGNSAKAQSPAVPGAIATPIQPTPEL